MGRNLIQEEAMEAPLVCKDCGSEFANGQAFSDHFERAKESATIRGCKKPVAKK
jgi:hypothetical protein